jgi:cell division initiation protein
VKVTPLDLKKQIFRKVMRGYDPVEVRTFLDMISDEFEKLLKENMSLTERVGTLDSQIQDYRNMEQALNDALLSAQKSLSASRENAQKEAELTIRDATIESEQIIQEARNRSQKLSAEVRELSRMKGESIAKLRSFLNSQLDMLSVFEASEGMADSLESRP